MICRNWGGGVSANALRAVESELVFSNKDLCYRYKFCRVNKSTMPDSKVGGQGRYFGVLNSYI